MGDYTKAARARRLRARQRGENVPKHKPGRPFRGCSALVAYAPLDVLLEQVVDRVENWDDDDERLWDVQAAIVGLEEALRRFPGQRSAGVPLNWIQDRRMGWLMAMRDGTEGTLRDIRRIFGEMGEASQRWLDSAGPKERIAARDQAAQIQKMRAKRERQERATVAADLVAEQQLEQGRRSWLELAD